MSLKDLGVSDNRIKALAKRNIRSVNDVQRFFPRAYYDFTTPKELSPIHADKFIAVVGTLEKVETKETNGLLMVKAKVKDEHTNKTLHVMWIGMYFMYKMIKDWPYGTRIIVCGKMTYSEEYRSFHMNNPLFFDCNIERQLRVYPVYKKMSGISEEFMGNVIRTAIHREVTETIPADLRAKYGLLEARQMILALHYPQSMKQLELAQKTLVYEELFSFALSVEKANREISKGSIYNIKSLKNIDSFVNSLAFPLTKSQKNMFDRIVELAFEGRRINALVQGDVGSGKTIAAFLAMLAMADSGYQSVLLAPTLILAKQHYQSILKYAESFGYKVALLTGETKQRERKQIYKGLESGEYTFVVGTHSVINPDIPYKNLALAVIDEEHKYGVEQRDQLTGRAKNGTHIISMSATPIPRTMAEAIYGTDKEIFDLELPENRKPVRTQIFDNDNGIYKFIYKKHQEGQQSYVVCPYIEEDEKGEIKSVESTLKEYEDYFKNYPDIKVGVVTGKMKQEDADAVINSFEKKEIHVLISTTIIEVGVNVPSANVIVINNAERFGLAQLHQLRGRVGRGSDEGFCILKSADKENPRLKIMVNETNGYKIAEEDMKLRGTGNILGTEQSGKDKYINLIMQYPNMYEFCKRDASEYAMKM